MISMFWVFAGFLTGMLITSVFTPPVHKVPTLPTPSDKTPIQTGTGCVKFLSEEMECDGSEVSLNVIASQHK
jgi:hypothetical protein